MRAIFFALAVFSSSAYAGFGGTEYWFLVNQQYAGGSWYCTYQLQGTSLQTTIQSQYVCQQMVTR